MNKNSVAFVLFLFLFGAIPVSCDILCLDDCGCGKNIPAPDFSIKELEVTDLVLSGDFLPDLYYPKSELYKSIKISVFEFLTEGGSIKKYFGFIESSFACDPAPSKALESIIELSITNKKEYTTESGEIMLAGSDISNKFSLSNNPNSQKNSIQDFLSSDYNWYLDQGLFLNWNDEFSAEQELVFDIGIKLSDGREFIFEDEIIKIKN